MVNPNLGRQFETGNPSGPNSVYTRLPDNRWERDKRATGEKFVMDKTIFVHPDYAAPHLIKGKLHGYKGVESVKVPKEAMSKEPNVGWTPFEGNLEWNEDKTKFRTKETHVGHPVVSINK